MHELYHTSHGLPFKSFCVAVLLPFTLINISNEQNKPVDVPVDSQKNFQATPSMTM